MSTDRGRGPDDDGRGRDDDVQGRDDTVERFFAAERAEVRPLPTDEGHWTSLAVEARRGRRTRRLHRTLGAAAAVLLVGGGVAWATRPGGADGHGTLPVASSSETTHPRPATSTTSPTAPSSLSSPAVSSAPSTPTGTTSPTSTTLAVPSTFRVVSVSNVGGGTLYALGTTTCGSSHTPCPALARTTDDGTTWRLVSSFPTAAVAPRGTGRVGTDDSLTQVRFASDRVGWVFGGALKMTTDGGRSWTDVKHSGRAVLDLETDGSSAVVTTTSGSCDGTSCSGTLSAEISSPLPWSPTPLQARLGHGSVSSADVAFQSGVAYVSPLGSGSLSGPWRVASSLGEVPSTCDGEVPGPVTIVAPAADDTVFAVCPSDGAAGSVGYHVAASTDGGSTWRPVSTDALTLVDSGSTAYAATDDTHLLAVSGGSADLKGSLQVSSDGGHTWHAPAAPPPTPAEGWSWVGAPGGATLYAVPVGGAAGFWVSGDHGEHWHQVRVAGR